MPGQPAVRCLMIKKNGQRCGAPPMRGQLYCGSHGARAPMRRKSAKRLLKAASIPAIGALLHTMRSTTDDYARIKAADSLLDRAGFGRKAQLDVVPSNSYHPELAEMSDAELVRAMEALTVQARTMVAAPAVKELPPDASAPDSPPAESVELPVQEIVLPGDQDDDEERLSVLQAEVEFSSLQDGTHPQFKELNKTMLESAREATTGAIEQVERKLKRLDEEIEEEKA